MRTFKSSSSHWLSSSTAFSRRPTNNTNRAGGCCVHLPLSHHNTLFKLDTAWSLFFLADLIVPVLPDLPYQSVKGIFHFLRYKTQLSSMLRNARGSYCMVHVLPSTDTQSLRDEWSVSRWVFLVCVVVVLLITQSVHWKKTQHLLCRLGKDLMFPP